ncbi:MAG: hypothetical protein EZS28_037160, partial [Streblomastix strix]
PLTQPIEKTGAGPGTACVFSMMRCLTLIFTIGTLISVALCIMYSQFSSHSVSSTTTLNIISIGNVIAGYWTSTPKVTLFNWILLPQLLFAILIYVGIRLMRKQVDKSEEAADLDQISCGDYGIMVEGLPKEEKSAQNIFWHFNNQKPVHSVFLCYNCGDHIDIQKSIDENVENNILDLENKRSQLMNPFNEDTTGIAFIIFKKAVDAQNVAESYYNNTEVSIFGKIKYQKPELTISTSYNITC